jgi:hypothetical protein
LALVAVAAVGSVAPATAQDSGVAGDLERTAQASPQEKAQYSADAAVELQASVKDVEKLAEEARREGDTEQVDCVNARLSQLRALAQVTEVAGAAMKDAMDAGQQERADHELRKIAVALSKSRQLTLEAQACVDDSGLASGETNVRVEGGLDGEGDETDALDVDVLDGGYDPPQQSPFN